MDRPKPFYPTATEIEGLISGRISAIVRPLKHQPHGHHWSTLPAHVNHKQTMNLLDCVGGPVAQFADHFDFIDRHNIHRQNWEENVSVRSPFGGAGTILAGKETWVSELNLDDDITEIYIHKHGNENYPLNSGAQWKSPITMPLCAVRLWFKVKEVKVCRVQDSYEAGDWELHQKLGLQTEFSGIEGVHDLEEKYKSWWTKLHGEKSWKSNPWIWYAEIERIEKPEGV